MKKSGLLLCLFLIASVCGNSIQSQAKKTTLYRKSVALGKAKEVKTDIAFFSGELIIGTSTDKLTECFYGYKDVFIRPYVSYSEVGHTGYLTVKSLKKDESSINKKKSNKWMLELNRDIQNDLNIELLAGEADIDLEDAHLSRLNYKMTAGELHLNLRGTSVPLVKFNLLAGEAHIDLSGKWHNDCMADIKGGVGEITVKVPYKTGVKVNVSGVLGDVNIPFFNREGRTYTNDAWEKTENNIILNISGAIGQINVEMAE
jgi:hypothetical protein